MEKTIVSLFSKQTAKAVIISAALLASSSALATNNLTPRTPINSTKYAISNNIEYTSIVVKFKETTGIRLGDSGLFTKVSNPEMPANFGLDWTGFDAELSNLQGLISAQGLNLTKSFSISDSRLAELKKIGEERSGKELADLGLYFKLPLPAGLTTTQIRTLVESINNYVTVEAAFVKPPAIPAAITPDFQDYNPENSYYQGYLDAPTPADNDAFDGINAKYAWNFSGGKGEGINVIDVEGGWNTTHEDFPTLSFDYNTTENNSSWVPHGTAVVGVIAGVDNGIGVTGIANKANIGVSNIFGANHQDANGVIKSGTSAAILRAADMAGEGGIVLIEVHREGPELQQNCSCNASQCNYIPVEYWSDDYEAIETATALGVTVVEAAGNGSANLDDAIYGNAFNRSQKDSGAIIVGASQSKNSEPMCWTNYGSRVDIRGWGEMVTTLYSNETNNTDGVYRDPDALDNGNKWYKFTFSGTSSASPIVTGAAAVLQGIAQKTYGTTLTPDQIRDILSNNGTDQILNLGKNIGALPDLEKAITKLDELYDVFVCSEVTDTNVNHEAASRAYSETVLEGQTCWGTYCWGGTETTTWYAVGSGDELGTNGSSETTLHEYMVDKYATGNCPGDITPTNSAPLITLNGASEITINLGENFIDPGATATDAEDGDLTAEIVITGFVDTNSIGAYTLTYTATDSGGLSDSKTRTVNVVSEPTNSCIEYTDTISNHETAERAYSTEECEGTLWLGVCYGSMVTTWFANGSNENLGNNGSATVTLIEDNGSFSTGTCPTDPVAPVLVSYEVASNTNTQAVITGIASDEDGDIDRVVLGLGAASGFNCEGTTNFTCTLVWDDWSIEVGSEADLSVSAWDSRNESSNVEYFSLIRPEPQAPSAPEISNLQYTVDAQSMVVTVDVTDVDGDLYAVRLMYADQIGELHCDNTGGNQYTCNLTQHDTGTFNFKVHAVDSEGLTAETSAFTVEFTEEVINTCVTDTNFNHVEAGRAYVGGLSNLYAYAVGSDDDLGLYGSIYYSATTSLEETSTGVWTLVSSCN